MADLSVTSGLVARFEVDAGVVLDADGSSIAAWQDLTGNGNDLTPRDIAPKLVAGRAPSGAPAAMFDGTGDLWADIAGANTGLPSGAADRTMFLVANYYEANTQWSGFAYGYPSTGQTFGLVATGQSTNRLAIQAWGSPDLTSSIDALEQPWLVQSATVQSGAVRHYKDGSLIHSGTRTYATNPERIAMAVNIAGGSSTRRIMDVCAVLIFDRFLPDDERLAVYDYLQAKYLTPPSGGVAVSAEPGALAVAGQAAALAASRHLAVQPGTLTLSGSAAALRHLAVLTAPVGVLALAGQPAALRHDRRLAAEAGSLVLTGRPAALSVTLDLRLVASDGFLDIDGVPAGFRVTRRLAAQCGTVAATGAGARLWASRRVTTAPGALALGGSAAGFGLARRLTAAEGTLAILGLPAGLLRTEVIPATIVMPGVWRTRTVPGAWQERELRGTWRRA
jgi:hypothetical protein